MQVPRGDDGAAVVAFVNTIHHDGHGGVTDDLLTDEGVATWLASQQWLPAVRLTGPLADELRVLRQATRALCADAVAPGPPSRADVGRSRMPADQALAVLESAAGALDLVHGHALVDGRISATRGARATAPRVLVPGMLAVAALDFLAGPDVGKLRSCQAPRCVRYFVKAHGRQEWCKETCATRARVARHADAGAPRRHPDPGSGRRSDLPERSAHPAPASGHPAGGRDLLAESCPQ